MIRRKKRRQVEAAIIGGPVAGTHLAFVTAQSAVLGTITIEWRTIDPDTGVMTLAPVGAFGDEVIDPLILGSVCDDVAVVEVQALCFESGKWTVIVEPWTNHCRLVVAGGVAPFASSTGGANAPFTARFGPP